MSSNKVAAGGLASIGLFACLFKTCSHEAPAIEKVIANAVVHEVPAIEKVVVSEAATGALTAGEDAVVVLKSGEKVAPVRNETIEKLTAERAAAKKVAVSQSGQRLNGLGRYSGRTVATEESSQVLVKDPVTGEFYIRNRTALSEAPLKELDINTRLPLVVNNISQLTAAERMILTKKGVKFLIDEAYYTAMLSRHLEVEVIYVASQDTRTMMQLMNVSEYQIDDVHKLFEPIFENQKIIKVAAYEQLQFALENCKQTGKTPIVVFNNMNNTLFGRAVSEFESQFITCNSYLFGMDGRVASLDYLNIKLINQTISQILSHSGKINELSFFQQLNYGYVDGIRRQRNMVAMLTITGGTATGGTASYIAYTNSNKG